VVGFAGIRIARRAQIQQPRATPWVWGSGGKGDRSNLPERPAACFAQIGPVPFFSLKGNAVKHFRAGKGRSKWPWAKLSDFGDTPTCPDSHESGRQDASQRCLSGLPGLRWPVPRALPWADESQPFGLHVRAGHDAAKVWRLRLPSGLCCLRFLRLKTFLPLRTCVLKQVRRRCEAVDAPDNDRKSTGSEARRTNRFRS